MRKWLKEIRAREEKTQAEVAQMVGISSNYYCYIEQGKRGVPVKRAKKIAEALGFDWTRFYGEIPDNSTGGPK